MNILITGAAGFIGSNLVKRLLDDREDVTVIGLDSVNDYYDVSLKEWRLKQVASNPRFVFIKGNIADRRLIDDTFAKYIPEVGSSGWSTL